MPDPRDVARIMRERLIAELQVCTCEYPVNKHRSMSGHDHACPAHQVWKQHNLSSTSRETT